MKRNYKARRSLDPRRLGFGIFTLFIIYVTLKILTPPSAEVARVTAPDGSRTARLRRFYYVSQPSYKVDYRESGKYAWLNLLYLPSYTNTPHKTAVETLEWSPDSQHLFFKINDTPIWYYSFDQ